MKIVIPGGSGQIGALLARHFAGHEVVILSRLAAPSPWRTVHWDGEHLGDWVKELDSADVVINLAGKNVNCRYTKANREKMLQSRVDSTKVIGEAIAKAVSPPKIWLQASTATIYAHRFDMANDEATGIIGGNETDVPASWANSVKIAKAWEETLDTTETPETRKVKLRASLVFSPDRDSIFHVLSRLVWFRLGGRAGNGNQYVSWIHHADFLRAIDFLIDHQLEGVVNITAPTPLPQKEFMSQLREAWGIRMGLPANRLMLEIGAWAMRTETELLLKSRRVIPGKLQNEGFDFKYDNWSDAVKDLVANWQ